MADRKDTIINLPGEAIDKAAADIINKTVGAASDGTIITMQNVLGGLFGDSIREWRTRKLIDRTSETAAIMKRKGIDLKQVRALPMGEWYALFESASTEESSEVGTLWSALLANALDPSSSVKIDNDLISVLKQLTPIDANILLFLDYCEKIKNKFKQKLPTQPRGMRPFYDTNEDCEWKEYDRNHHSVQSAAIEKITPRYEALKSDIGDQFSPSIGNLSRLSLIEHHKRKFDLGKIDHYGLQINLNGTSEDDLHYLHTEIDEKIEEIERALEIIAESTQSLNLNSQTKILPDSMSLNNSWTMYDLTSFGRRLMDACDSHTLSE